jgi:hypothetical protein
MCSPCLTNIKLQQHVLLNGLESRVTALHMTVSNRSYTAQTRAIKTLLLVTADRKGELSQNRY